MNKFRLLSAFGGQAPGKAGARNDGPKLANYEIKKASLIHLLVTNRKSAAARIISTVYNFILTVN